MKGIDISNYEADVEFVPPRAIGAGTYIAVGTTDNTHTNTIDCNNAPVVAEELIVYRSKCHIDDIPDVARGLTWNDPFYDAVDHTGNTPTEIIAAFDIDRTLYDRSTYDLFKWFILIPMYSLSLLPLCLVWGIAGVFLYWYFIYGVFLSLNYVVVDCKRHESRLRINCTHIAVSTRGIYIDEVDAPGSYNLMSRTRISYDEIKKCQVKSEYNCFNRTMNYKVTINTNDDREVKGEKEVVFIPRYTIEGLQKQQKFVDIVNAMMERNARCVASPALNSEVVESRAVLDALL